MPAPHMASSRAKSAAACDLTVIHLDALAYASLHSPSLATMRHEGVPIGALLAVMRVLVTAIHDRPGVLPVVVMDQACEWRQRICPGYLQVGPKEIERQRMRDLYAGQRRLIQSFLDLAGIPCLFVRDGQASDAAAHLWRTRPPGRRIELFTKELSWLQAVDEQTSWYNPMSQITVDLENFKTTCPGAEGLFDSPGQFLSALALAGDASDGMPGPRGIGLKTAGKLLAQFASFDAFWEALDEARSQERARLLSSVASKTLADPNTEALYWRNLTLLSWFALPDQARFAQGRYRPNTDSGVKALQAGLHSFGLHEVAEDLGRELAQSRISLGPDWGETFRDVRQYTEVDWQELPVVALNSDAASIHNSAVSAAQEPGLVSVISKKSSPFSRFGRSKSARVSSPA